MTAYDYFCVALINRTLQAPYIKPRIKHILLTSNVRKVKMLSRQKKCDYHFPLVLLGRQAVGKSSIVLRFSEDVFSPMYTPTYSKPLIHKYDVTHCFALLPFNRHISKPRPLHAILNGIR